LKSALEKYTVPYATDDDLGIIIDAIGDAKIVLLGEASHGTSEFYTTRTQLTKKLIEEKCFSVIAVEGGWPSCQQVNRYIKNYGPGVLDTQTVLNAFNDWPTWMWANEDVVDLIDWLKLHNEQHSKSLKIGFYGVDIYSLWRSMEELFFDLTTLKPAGEDINLAKKVFSCFQRFDRSPEQYAISTVQTGRTCTKEVTELLAIIRANIALYPSDMEQDLNLLINALVLKNAEAYYRAATQQNALSWNIRDTHMVETINELRTYHGEDAKIIVWEHNTHIGDARATTMKDDGTINVGQILREQNKKEDVYAIGFGTYRGTVIASDEWGAPHKIMNVPPAKKGSWEDLLHQSGAFDKILVFTEENRKHFTNWIDHRAIGVTYDPAFEKYNYVPSQIGYRYDTFIHIEETTALKPFNK